MWEYLVKIGNKIEQKRCGGVNTTKRGEKYDDLRKCKYANESI